MSDTPQTRYVAKINTIDPMLSEFQQLKLHFLYHNEFVAETFGQEQLRQMQENLLAREERHAIAAQLRDMKNHLIELEEKLYRIEAAQRVAERSTGAPTP